MNTRQHDSSSFSQRLKHQLQVSHFKGYTTYPNGEHRVLPGMKPIHANTYKGR